MQQGNPFDQFDGPTQGLPAGAQVLIPESATVRAKDSADLSNAQISGRRAAQGIQLDAEQAARQQAAEERQRTALVAELYTKGLRIGANGQPEAIPGWKDPTKATPAQNVDPAAGLQRAINDMRKLFKSGPGATSGIYGIKDFLPLEANKAFDKAASSARGYVGPALGLTASQLNSPGEIEAAIGPYIATSGDYDTNIKATFERLQGLANDQRQRAGYTGPVAGMEQQQGAVAGAPTVGGASGGGGNGPAGYDVSGIGGVAPGGGGNGGSFIDAAGIKMAQRMSQAYNRGASASDINKLLRDNGYQELGADGVRAIEKRGPINFAPPAVDDTRGSVGRALGDVASSPLGAYAISAGDAVTAGTLDNIAGGQAGLAMDYAREQNPTASLLGSITGGALAAGGAEIGLGAAGLSAGRAALAGDALYGAAYGAGSADDGQSRLAGAVLGGGLGLGGGLAGRAAARGIGTTLTGGGNANARALRDAGVDGMTVGQVTGGAIKSLEDRMTGFPVIGNMIGARRTESMQGFNRAAFNEALAPIGANTGGVTREAGVDAARAARSQAYGDALDNVQVQADAPFVSDMQGAIAAGRALPDPMSGNLDYTLPTRVGNSFDVNGGLSGRDFQQSVRGLRRDANAVANQPYGYDFGQVTRQAEGALEGLLQRQAPDALPAYNAANAANRNVEVLKDAVNRARNGTRVGESGTFAPSQLADAAAANARRYGGGQGTTNQPFFNLTRAGQDVLPNSVPDSGTAGRIATQSILGLGGLGGAGYVADQGEGAAKATGAGLGIAGILAAGASRPAQRVLVRALLDRPQIAVNLGRGIQNRAARGGIFGAPLLAGAAPAAQSLLFPTQ